MTRIAQLLGCAGVAAFVWGAWIPAKAVAAQVLIAHAWQEARAGKANPKPWSWADTWPIARLEAPTLGRAAFVLAGASGQAMAFGPGHVSSTAMPGERGNIVIAGHRDTHFAFLAELSIGDPIILEGPTTSTRYLVRETAVLHETQTEILEPSTVSQLTLITCFPFDAVAPGGPLRYVVRAAAY